MTRTLAFVAALFMTAIAVSSACVAASTNPLQFWIEPHGRQGQVQVRIERLKDGKNNRWQSTFRAADLDGLDVAALNASGTRPLRFNVVREAGRVDCAGTGGGGSARGTCTVTPDQAFARLLRENGARAASEDETLGMISLGVRRDLITALAQARYPKPAPSDLMALTAIDVTPAYVRGLAGQGYRPKSLEALVQFGALKISPEYVGSFARAGYGDLSADSLVQLKAMNVTANYVRGFELVGYGRLPVETLVQFKALGVTPEFARAARKGSALPSPERLIMLRAIGGR